MRNMKDSGIEWIGEIPEDWEIKRISNVYKERTEKVSDKDYAPLSVTKRGVVPQLENAAKTTNGDNRKLVKKGDFAINSRSDRRGSCGISPLDGSVSLIMTVLKPYNNIVNQYYNYVFRSERFSDEFYKWGHGIVDDLWSTKWEYMKRINIPFPDKEQQELISNYLDNKVKEIDNIISKTQETIEEYKKYRQSVITEAVTKGINPNVEMKDSGTEWVGQIPKDWEIVSLGHIFDFIGGYAYKSEKFTHETNNQVLRLGNIKNNNLILDEKRVFIDDNYAQVSQNALVYTDDILFTMTGTKGKRDYFYTLIVKDTHLNNKKLFLNQRVGCFRKKLNICMNYYNYALKNNMILDFIFLYETGTANQGNLGIETIKRTKIYYPKLDEQLQIANYLDKRCTEIDNLISKKEELITQLELYKKSLIYECVTGKKEVAVAYGY